MHVRKPTICERAFGSRFAIAYNKLFMSRCIRAVNLTGQGVASYLKGEQSTDKSNSSFNALHAASRMKGIRAVEKNIFRFNHGGLVNKELSRQINLISFIPIFELLAKQESQNVEVANSGM